MHRRDFIVGGGSAVAASGAAGTALAQAPTKVRLVQSNYGFLFVPAMAAQEMGHFAKHGLEADFTVNLGGTEAIAAALSGDADIVVEAASSALRSRQRGTDATIFGTSCNRYASNVVISKALAQRKGVDESSAIDKKIEALRGAKIAVIGLGSGTHQLLLYLLNRGKMRPDADLEILGIGQVSGVLASFEQGRIDGFVASSPNSDLAVQKFNGLMLFNMAKGAVPDLNDYPYITYISRASWLAKNPGTLTRFRAAIDDALGTLHDPAQGIATRDKIHAKYFDKLDKELFDGVWADTRDAWPRDARVTRAMGQKALDFLNVVTGESYPTSLLDTAFRYD